MMVWFFLMILGVVVAVAMVLAAVFALVSALVGGGAFTAYLAGRKPLPPGAPPTRADSWLSFFGVTLLGLVPMIAACGSSVLLEDQTMQSLIDLRDPHANKTFGVVILFVLVLIPALGGAIAGFLHVLLRRRSWWWVSACTVVYSLPTYVVLAVFYAGVKAVFVD